MDKWTREETIIAFNLYCKIPFKDSSKTHPDVIRYARILGRTPSAVNMKIGNIGRLDPSLRQQGIMGLTHGARMEEDVWREFRSNPTKFTYESERLIAEYSHKKIEETSQIDTQDLPQGKEREAVVKQRVNQSFFRSAVLNSYNFVCCITGVGNPQLLDACHIVDWSQDEANRTNPCNGLCMTPLFHRAYDKHLMAITPDYEIVVSDEMIERTEKDDFKTYLHGLDGRTIILPDKFMPSKELLDIHYSKFIR